MNNNIETIFATARELQAADRSGYLDEACAGDAELRSQVEALLAADMDAGSFLKSVEHDPDATLPQTRFVDSPAIPSESAGQIIGKYKLLQSIGEGGFGTVWMAEQKEPVKRRVALKIIKLGMDTKQVIARFEAERQALAMMDHPNIAKVFDAGSTETGRPFFVMELVRGVPILEYCDTEKLDTKSRLNLFTLVCNAIQHAHQKGIIHRDIKPGNVLVTLHDGVPVPKVIDFGIAKATSQELTQKTLFTEHHQMIGTPAYMSPEQAEMSGLDIDTRSDIYSLGVLLYELLTGTTPFAHQELMERGFGEMMRIIREETPHKPSTRLSTLGETGTRAAEQRHTDIRKLGLVLRGDLDWIVMKCLEKDRTRRYDTANGLAADIVRHLSDEPVIAGPPSAGYKIGKFVKRNRGQVIAGGAIAAMLVLGVVGTSTGMVWALNEKDRADEQTTLAKASAEAEKEAKIKAESNEQKAVEEAAKAERELARATEIKTLITQMLTSVSPVEALGADTTLLKGILNDAAQRLSNGEITDELIAAELRHTIAIVLMQLGHYDQAEVHLDAALEARQRVLGNDHIDTLEIMNNLCLVYRGQGRLEEAERKSRLCLERYLRAFGRDNSGTMSMMANLGSILRSCGKYEEAESYLRESVEAFRRNLGADHPDTQTQMNNLASVLMEQGNYKESERIHLSLLENQRRVLGNDHPSTLTTMSNLATVYLYMGKLEETEPLYRESLETCRRIMGEDHPHTIKAINNLGHVLSRQSKFDEAEPIVREGLQSSRRIHGNDHPTTVLAIHNMGVFYSDQGKYDEAILYFREAVDGARRVLGEDHPQYEANVIKLMVALRDRGDLAESEVYYRLFLESRQRVYGEQDPLTLSAYNWMGWILYLQNKFEESIQMYSIAYERQQSVLGKDHADTLNSLSHLANTRRLQGRFEESELYYREYSDSMKRLHGDEHTETLTAINNVGHALNNQEKFDEALELLKESEPAVRATWAGADLGNYLIKIGYAQTGVGQYAQAESTLLEAYPIVLEGFGQEHAKTQTCITHLVDLYIAWHTAEPGNGYDTNAEEWHEKLNTINESNSP